MRPKFMALSDGNLYPFVGDGRLLPVRTNYALTHREIKSGQDLRATLRAGPYAWPGGYTLYFVTEDGEALSFQTVRENLREVTIAIRSAKWGRSNNGWRVVGCDVNYEDGELFDAHTNERIPSAYAEPEA